MTNLLMKTHLFFLKCFFTYPIHVFLQGLINDFLILLSNLLKVTVSKIVGYHQPYQLQDEDFPEKN